MKNNLSKTLLAAGSVAALTVLGIGAYAWRQHSSNQEIEAPRVSQETIPVPTITQVPESTLPPVEIKEPTFEAGEVYVPPQQEVPQGPVSEADRAWTEDDIDWEALQGLIPEGAGTVMEELQKEYFSQDENTTKEEVPAEDLYQNIDLTELKDKLSALGTVKNTSLPIDLKDIPYVEKVYAYAVSDYIIAALEIDSGIASAFVSGMIQSELDNLSTETKNFSLNGIDVNQYTATIKNDEYDVCYGVLNGQHFAILTKNKEKANNFSQVFDVMLGV